MNESKGIGSRSHPWRTRQEVLTMLEHRYIVHSDYAQATVTIASDVKQVIYMHGNTCPRILLYTDKSELRMSMLITKTNPNLTLFYLQNFLRNSCFLKIWSAICFLFGLFNFYPISSLPAFESLIILVVGYIEYRSILGHVTEEVLPKIRRL